MLLFQANIEKQLAKLQAACAERRRYLKESKKLHEYLQESNEVDQWIAEQVVMAGSEDFGKDYEHIQVSSLS